MDQLAAKHARGDRSDDDEEGIQIEDEEYSGKQSSLKQRGTESSQTKEVAPEIQFDVGPIKATCHQCMVEITTFVQHEMNPFFPIVAIFVLFVFGYLSLIILPVIYLLT